MFKRKINDEICLKVLEETCKKYDINECSIGIPLEQKVCICKRKDKWEVFVLERTFEFDKNIHTKCIDACIEVIKYCSYSIDEFKEISNEFINILSSKANVNKCKIRIKR